MRDVCYCMTRNLYPRIVPSLKSLLTNGNVDRVYILAESDGIGIDLPECVKVINVSNQNWFRLNGPNAQNVWTYMVMMRIALCHVFPGKQKILSLDVDTIIRGDISSLWDIDLDGKYCAAVEEPNRKPGSVYVNCGVVLWNLDEMRSGKADEVIRNLNARWYEFSEQDAFNEAHEGKVHLLPAGYNATHWTGMPADAVIRHYAAEQNWWNKEELEAWKQKPWVIRTETGTGNEAFPPREEQ